MSDIYHIHPTGASLIGDISLPSSKSISNRVLLLNALSNSPYEVENLSDCEDTAVMLKALQSSEERTIDILAAGTAMRFLTAYYSHHVGEWILTGTERMCKRPIKPLVDALCCLGAQISYLSEEGYPPLRIKGVPLKGGAVSLSAGISSQYISALLMLAPLMENGLRLRLEGEVLSRPYIQLTQALMKQYGVHSTWEGDTLCVAPSQYIPCPFSVESDWSAASYWYEVMALSTKGGELFLKGLQADSKQGDSAVARLFELLGVSSEYLPGGVMIRKEGECCTHLSYNFEGEPDLVQTFVCTCLGLRIPFRFTGLQSLRIKETDRISALQNEAEKFGFVLHSKGDTTLEWDGKQSFVAKTATIKTYDDHRMAMSFAPLSLVLSEGICISHPEVVRKSYPTFWETLSPYLNVSCRQQ